MTTLHSRRLAASLSLALVGALTLAMPAAATNTVTQAVTGGTRTASIADVTLTAKNYSHADQTSTGSMTLTADDSTGTGDGWNVTVQSSAFVYSGTEGGTDIPASNFSLTSSAAPVYVAGQAIDTTGTDLAPTGPQLGTLAGVSGTLDTARKTIRAGVGYGQGNYTQALSVSLTIPGQSKAGTYTGTMTVTISAAP